MSVRGFAVEGIDSLPDGDAVIDFEITANRPDCMSVIGMAREVAAAYGLQVRRPAIRGRSTSDTGRMTDRKPAASTDAARPVDGAEPRSGRTRRARRRPALSAGGPGLHLMSLKTVEHGDIEIAIENPDLCPRYAGAVADVTVGTAPEWMQSACERPASGQSATSWTSPTTCCSSSVSRCMPSTMRDWEAGRSACGPRVKARPSERSTARRARSTPEMLVIADAERAVAVAGVMGGADSEVTGGTTTIVLESACFNPLSVGAPARRWASRPRPACASSEVPIRGSR